ncbi:hypothetical protein OOZ63_12115 [Paucibacter sp. PLA-PC-4]|uniref:hypothetical protein n=1 Tax=Paucibacter sp. PLA-PC-4 TaxID=2993655 RepID=UPI00224966EF|nr:hypothetical protein [Paucibacter sp. PLA-PC-4]MCX2862585.1 hypothetical protein [Paucibacter sp. PLA-PC-4]
MQVGPTPSQRIQTRQHVVTDSDVDGAKVEGVERKDLPVVGRNQKACHSGDLTRVALLGQSEQARKCLSTSLRSLPGPPFASSDLGSDFDVGDVKAWPLHDAHL